MKKRHVETTNPTKSMTVATVTTKQQVAEGAKHSHTSRPGMSDGEKIHFTSLEWPHDQTTQNGKAEPIQIHDELDFKWDWSFGTGGMAGIISIKKDKVVEVAGRPHNMTFLLLVKASPENVIQRFKEKCIADFQSCLDPVQTKNGLQCHQDSKTLEDLTIAEFLHWQGTTRLREIVELNVRRIGAHMLKTLGISIPNAFTATDNFTTMQSAKGTKEDEHVRQMREFFHLRGGSIYIVDFPRLMSSANDDVTKVEDTVVITKNVMIERTGQEAQIKHLFFGGMMKELLHGRHQHNQGKHDYIVLLTKSKQFLKEKGGYVQLGGGSEEVEFKRYPIYLPEDGMDVKKAFNDLANRGWSLLENGIYTGEPVVLTLTQ